MAKTPRKWTGARTPSGLKRVRSAERRHAILGPRRAAAKTLVKSAIALATVPTDGEDPQVAMAAAMSALDRAAKVGAIHPNNAARRKSRLARRIDALLGGTHLVATGHVAKTIGKAAAQKAAKARIAAGKADKAKGAQTAAGKARAALSRTARSEAAAAAATPAAEETAPTAPKRATARAATSKAPAPKATAKPAAKKATKAATPKAAVTKAPATKATAKAPAPKATAAKAPATKAAAKPAAKKATKA